MSEKLPAQGYPDSQDLFESQLESRKLDSLKELAYGASHEINNPLANIAARAQTLLLDEKDPQRRLALQAIHRQALRAHEMISDLMLFARPPEIVRERVDLKSLILGATQELSQEYQQRDVQLVTRLPDEMVEISVDAGQLTVALQALLLNGLEAIGTSGTIWIELKCIPSKRSPKPDSQIGELPTHATDGTTGLDPTSAGQVEIRVSDDGPGLTPHVSNHLFDPFFSGREAGRGLGFGLSKCWRIITEHGGSIQVGTRQAEEACEQGTIFTIALPVT